jgi:hypothetical protein
VTILFKSLECIADVLVLVLAVWLASTHASAEDELAACRRLAPKYHAQLEYMLEDGSRVDMLTTRYAVEADRAHKWTEAVGQSVYYALMTKREPAILLLISDREKEQRYIDRCQKVCDHLHIKLFLEPFDKTPMHDGK